MKVLLFSDLHAHAFRPYSKVGPNGRNSRLQDALNILEEINTIANENNVDLILFAGDLFHIRPGVGAMKIPTFNAVFEAVARLRMRSRQVALLVGNHDQGNKEGTEHSIYAFGSILTVMDEPKWYQFDVSGEKLAVLALPAAAPEVHRKAITEGLDVTTPAADYHIILGHLGIDGASVGTNFKLHGGQTLKLEELRYNEVAFVFLGDYHMPQKLRGNVFYIGATHHHNWGDVGQQRRCLIWDTKPVMTLVHPQPQEHFLAAAPSFIRIGIEHWKEQPGYLYDGNFVRVVHDSSVTPEEMDRIKTSITDAGAQVVEFWRNPETQSTTLEVGGQFQPSMDREDMVRLYTDLQAPDDLDEELLVDMGHEIINAAMAKEEQ